MRVQDTLYILCATQFAAAFGSKLPLFYNNICDDYVNSTATCVIQQPKLLNCSTGNDTNTYTIPETQAICDVFVDGALQLTDYGMITCVPLYDCQVNITVVMSLVLEPNTHIQASTVTINADYLVVSSGATINSNGLGWAGGPGQPGVAGHGGGHVGVGGSFPCASPSADPANCCDGTSYQRNDTLPYDSYWDVDTYWELAFGSGGGGSATAGRGGGRVRISANTLRVDGTISADGAIGNITNTSPIGAGAGGTVAIECNELYGGGAIRANGGPASSLGLWAAGAGGRVVIRHIFTAMGASFITAHGGTYDKTPSSPSSCLMGAVGSVFLVDASSVPSVNQLRMSGAGVTALAVSTLNIYDDDSFTVLDTHSYDDLAAVDSLTVSNYALVASSLLVTRRSSSGLIVISTGARLLSSNTQATGSVMNITCLVFDIAAAHLDTGLSDGRITAANVTFGQGAGVHFLASFTVAASHTLILQNQIIEPTVDTGWSPLRNVAVLQAGQSLWIQPRAVLAISSLRLVSYGNTVIAGRVSSIASEVMLIGMCQAAVQFGSACDIRRPPGEPDNNTLTVWAQTEVEVTTEGEIFTTAGLICARKVKLYKPISADGFGCPGGEGSGPGIPGLSAGGGAGHAAQGGKSADGATGGRLYDNAEKPIMMGSGGGSGSDTGGSGGGVITVYAFDELEVLSTAALSADGEGPYRGGAGGGGSGGSIMIFTDKLSGYGVISAKGGDGDLGGGGGSGGMIALQGVPLLRASEGPDKCRATASIVKTPLLPDHLQLLSDRCGCETTPLSPSSYHVTACALLSDLQGPADQNLQRPLTEQSYNQTFDEYIMRMLQTEIAQNFFGQVVFTGGDGSVGGSAGGDGSFIAPACPAGYAGIPRCTPCGVGKYRKAGAPSVCLLCSNAPSNSFYTDTSSATEVCAYVCASGHLYPSCATAFEQAMDLFGGPIGFWATAGGISILLFIVLCSLCMWRRLTTAKRFRPLNETSRLIDDHSVDFGSFRRFRLDTSYAFEALSQPITFSEYSDAKFEALVASAAIGENEFKDHVGRIYLQGFNTFGRPWAIPGALAHDMRFCVKRKRFDEFASDLNSALAWSACSWDALVYIFLSWTFYPVAARFLLHRKRVKARILLSHCFQKAVTWLKSDVTLRGVPEVRVGLSGDLSLAYVDILLKHSPSSDVILTPYAASLPLVLPFAGEGTFTSPYYLDPNDQTIRAIPSLPHLSTFIDDHWVEFVAGLNSRTRLISTGAENITASHLVEYLHAVNSDAELLGGLRVRLFWLWPGLNLADLRRGRYQKGKMEDASVYDLNMYRASLDTARLGLVLDMPAMSPSLRASSDAHNVIIEATVPQAKISKANAVNQYKEIEFGTFQLAIGEDGVSAVRHSTTDGEAKHNMIVADKVYTQTMAPTTSGVSNSPSSHRKSRVVEALGPTVVRRHYRHGTRCWPARQCLRGLRDEVLFGFVDAGGGEDVIGSHLITSFSCPGVAFGSTEQTHTSPPGTCQRELSVGEAGFDFASRVAQRVSKAERNPAGAAVHRKGRYNFCFSVEKLLRRRSLAPEAPRSYLTMLIGIACLFSLLIELALTVIISTQLFCIEPGTEAGGNSVDGPRRLAVIDGEDCDYTPFIIYIATPPGATFLPPLLGLAGIALQSASNLLTYSSWNGRSLWTAVFAVVITILYSHVLGVWIIAISVSLLVAKVVTAQLVPTLLAKFEADRPVRGWRGLYEVRRGAFEKAYRRYSHQQHK